METSHYENLNFLLLDKMRALPSSVACHGYFKENTGIVLDVNLDKLEENADIRSSPGLDRGGNG